MLRLCRQKCLISTMLLFPIIGPGCVDSSIDTFSTGSTATSTSTTEGATGTTFCSNGEVNPTEVCDDKNNADGDGCNNDCGPSGSMVWCNYDIGQNGNSNTANSVSVDSQGNALIVGHVNNKETDRFDIIVAKYSSEGKQLWLRQFSGTGEASPNGYGSAVDSKDRIIVSADFGSGNQRAPTLMRLSSSGELEWKETFEEPWVFANNNIALSSSSNIAVFGHTDTAPPKAFIATIDTDGMLAWKRSLDDITTESRAYALTSDQGGKWTLGGDILTKSIPTGEDTPSRDFFEAFLRRYSPTGDEEWTTKIPASDEDHSIHLAAVQATSGTPVIALWNTTEPFVGSGTRMSTGKLDAIGSFISQAVIPIEEYSIGGAGLVPGSDEDFFIAGTITPGDPNGPPLVGFASRHNSTNSTRWLYQNTIVSRSSNFMAIALASPGYLYVAGTQGIMPSPETRILLCLLRQ